MIRNFFSGLRWKDNIYVALVLSLLLIMALYALGRIGFYFFNLSFFPGMSWSRMGIIFWGGLRFDLSATLYSNSLFILLMIVPVAIRFRVWYQKLLYWIFIVVNAIAFAINTADFIYYRFTLRRTTVSVIDQFKNDSLKKYSYALIIFIFCTTILYRGIANARYLPVIFHLESKDKFLTDHLNFSSYSLYL